MQHKHDGQALILVALTMSLLVLLAIGVNQIQLERRSQARINNSLATAAHAAAAQVQSGNLVGDTTSIDQGEAEDLFRTTLEEGLQRVRNAMAPDPATVAAQAQFRLVETGDDCYGQVAQAAGVCASITVTTSSGMNTITKPYTTLAESPEFGATP